MSFFVRAGVLSGFSALMVELGANPGPIFHQLGLATDVLNDEEDLITLDTVNALLDAAVKSTICPELFDVPDLFRQLILGVDLLAGPECIEIR